MKQFSKLKRNLQKYKDFFHLHSYLSKNVVNVQLELPHVGPDEQGGDGAPLRGRVPGPGPRGQKGSVMASESAEEPMSP